MGQHVKCTGKDLDDCLECHSYYTFHSLHYDQVRRKEVTDIGCSIGGNKQLDEDGNEI
jgi:hypothetical protein